MGLGLCLAGIICSSLSLFWLVLNVSFNHIPKENSLVSPTAPQEETPLQQDLLEGGRAGSTGRADIQAGPHTYLCRKMSFCLPAKAMLWAGSWVWRAHTGRDTTAPVWERADRDRGDHPENGSLQYPPPCKLPGLSLSFCLFSWKKKKVIQWQSAGYFEVLSFLYCWDVLFSWLSLCVDICFADTRLF